MSTKQKLSVLQAYARFWREHVQCQKYRMGSIENYKCGITLVLFWCKASTTKESTDLHTVQMRNKYRSFTK